MPFSHQKLQAPRITYELKPIPRLFALLLITIHNKFLDKCSDYFSFFPCLFYLNTIFKSLMVLQGETANSPIHLKTETVEFYSQQVLEATDMKGKREMSTKLNLWYFPSFSLLPVFLK